MDIFIARQPIFDAEKNIYAYELLFRSGLSNAFPQIDGETATSSLLSSSFFTVGIDRVSGGKKVFINFTEQLLNDGVPTMFPADKVVVEILETVQATNSVIDACTSLVQSGYSLALDDYVCESQLAALIDLATIIKVDFRQNSTDCMHRLVHQFRNYNCKLLAEKIEDYEEFKEALALGFDYFQGYFFARPEILQDKEITSSQLTTLQLINELHHEQFDSDHLEALIRQDISLTYKLLGYLNSTFFSGADHLHSIREAIELLGEQGMRLFVSVVAASTLAEQKPDELIKVSLIRARFLEQLGYELNKNGRDFYLLGLFSLLDAMLDNSMENVLAKISVPGSVSEALVHRRGELFPYVNLVEKYESCDWGCVDSQLVGEGVSGDQLLAFYLDALEMADAAEDAL